MDVVSSAPATPALALIGLGVAFLLAMTRLSVRRRRKHAAGPFPQITPAAPAPIPTPAGLAGTNPAAEHNASPGGQAVDVSADAPATPVLGLIALGVAVLLVTSRLFARRRRNRR
jgi:heme A synthase